MPGVARGTLGSRGRSRAQARAHSHPDRRRQHGRTPLGPRSQRLARGVPVHVGARRVLPGAGPRPRVRGGRGRRLDDRRGRAGRVLCLLWTPRAPRRRARAARGESRLRGSDGPPAAHDPDHRAVAGARDRRPAGRARSHAAGRGRRPPRGAAVLGHPGPTRRDDGDRTAAHRRCQRARSLAHRDPGDLPALRRDPRGVRASPRRIGLGDPGAARTAARPLRVCRVLLRSGFADRACGHRASVRRRHRHGARAPGGALWVMRRESGAGPRPAAR